MSKKVKKTAKFLEKTAGKLERGIRKARERYGKFEKAVQDFSEETGLGHGLDVYGDMNEIFGTQQKQKKPFNLEEFEVTSVTMKKKKRRKGRK